MRRLVLVLSIAALAPAVPAGADWPITQPGCSDVSATVSVWRQLGTDVLENLGFDDLGNVWISNSSKGRIERWSPSGTAPDHTIALGGPGAIQRVGEDLYANFGGGVPGALLRTAASGIVRFDRNAPPATPPAPFASGVNMANGGTNDGTYLYVSNDFDAEVSRIRLSDGHVEQAWSKVYGTNGLVVHDGWLYAAITFDQRSPIDRIRLDAPGTTQTWTELSFGAVSLEPNVRPPGSDPATTPLVGLKGLDDMTFGPDGRLYVVANGMGELLRVDLATKEACLLASGLQNPSSVRFASSFGAFTGDIFVTEFSGAVKRVTLS